MIQAKVITYSINKFGNRLTTLEVVMPRYILAEFNTHRILSKNSASSRAIPPKKMRRSVEENTFIPYAWQKEHTGMQGTEYFEPPFHEDGVLLWKEAGQNAIESHVETTEYGITKQLSNRLLEPFMYHKVLVSGTEWDNFFALRCPMYEYSNSKSDIKTITTFKSRKDCLKVYPELKNYTILDWLKINKGQADIHMMFLAEAIYDAMHASIPNQLKEGEWHLPYGDMIDIDEMLEHGEFSLLSNKSKDEIITELKVKISTARSARLSYQTLGDNPVIDYKKDFKTYNDLVVAEPIHASPAEHPSRSMTEQEYYMFSKSYITDKITERIKEEEKRKITSIHSFSLDGIQLYKITEYGWCRNYRGFIMSRALLGV